jgi:lipopolysaccharide transport system permease protein
MSYFKTLYGYRELMYNLVMREIKARYKQTVLGASWAILQPLALMIVFTIVFSHFARIPSDGIPYPLFSYAALLPWTFFAGSLSRGVGSLVANQALVRKIYFPREIMPLAAVAAGLVDFLIASALFVGMLVYYGVPLTQNALLFIPIFVIQVTFVLGIVLLLAPLNVFYRDIGHVMPLLIQVWMFASPILYPLSMVPERFRGLYALNPMVGIIDGYRKTLIQGLPPDFAALQSAAAVAAVCFLGGIVLFKRLEFKLADVI